VFEGNADVLGTILKRFWSDLSSHRAARRTAAVPVQPPTAALEQALAAVLRKSGGIAGPVNYAAMAWVLAATDAARYMATHMASAEDRVERESLLDFALSRCSVAGHVLEFGVYKGASLRRIAARAGQEVHGFDSFEGLPDDWTYFQKRGRFGLKGEVPTFDQKNVVIHRGWFEQTLPPFLAEHDGPVRFLHVDCDIYASAAYVLDAVAARLVPGTVIVFDEYLNYPGWEQHEFRAFQEYKARRAVSCRYIGFASNANAVALQIEAGHQSGSV
jgi:predicted O-methyltransferase YrrM